MNRNSTPTRTVRLHAAPLHRDVSGEPLQQGTPGPIHAVWRQCSALLDAELQFYGRLESLLTALVTANLFSTETATSLSGQMNNFQRERDEMNRHRDECQRALQAIVNRPPGPVRMSDLEPLLAEDDRADFRRRRLQIVRRAEGMQKLLWRTDVLLASRHGLFSDLLAALTGQSTSANCYGANGRREHHTAVSVIEAVS